MFSLGDFLYRLSGLYSSGREQSFVANRPFLIHIWDRKLKTAILSGRLKEFEGKKRKQVYLKGDGDVECYDVYGKKSTCKLKFS